MDTARLTKDSRCAHSKRKKELQQENSEKLFQPENDNPHTKMNSVTNKDSDTSQKQLSQDINPTNLDIGVTRIFVSNVPLSILDEELLEVFEKVGTVESIERIHKNGEFTRKLFVEYGSAHLARLAVQRLSCEQIRGQPIKIVIASNNKSKKRNAELEDLTSNKQPRFEQTRIPLHCTTVFVGNLAYDIQEKTIRRLLKDCGSIREIRWVLDKESGQFKGCCFIEFANNSAVVNALAINGTELLGRPVRVDYVSTQKGSIERCH